MENLILKTKKNVLYRSFKKTEYHKLLPLVLTLFFFIFFTACKKSLQENQMERTATSAELQSSAALSANNAQIGINVLLNTVVSNAILNDLKTYGNILDVLPELNVVAMRAANNKLPLINNLPYVSMANPDAERTGAPTDAVAATDFTNGLSTWDLDAVNVCDFGIGRTVDQDGTGVYIAVLDTGLPDSWRQYFPQERIATQYARSFGGGGGEMGTVSTQPNKWQHDQHTHGGHVTSTIIGYQFRSVYINGVAPKATIIPVKVLNQNGSGWSSVIARGIIYIANLKRDVLQNSPVIINMSFGGPVLDVVEKAAIDYAISQGVILVGAAGNSGDFGMLYPGAYQPVISAAAAGWMREWSVPNWWFAANVNDPSNVNDFYIAPFSSRQKTGQDLDVVAPGVNVVGPFQLNSGQLSYYYLSGTSMASPHVAGIVALMAQKKSTLTAAEAETIVESAALPMGAGSRNFGSYTISWGTNASGSGLITADAALAATN
jgi:subtilisin family serine protease